MPRSRLKSQDPGNSGFRLKRDANSQAETALCNRDAALADRSGEHHARRVDSLPDILPIHPARDLLSSTAFRHRGSERRFGQGLELLLKTWRKKTAFGDLVFRSHAARLEAAP